MPTTYAHYRFGKDVLSCLPMPLRNSIREHRELYDIGLHGPDILFYYKVLSKNPVNQTGYRLHAQKASEFFLRAKNVLDQTENKAAARAYLYGFICHFALDSTCHPYIEKMIQVSGISHSEIETEFDRLLLTEDHYNPVKHLSVNHIHPTERNASIIAPFFENITTREIQVALKDMIRYHKLLLMNSEAKRKLLLTAMKILQIYDTCHGMIMNTAANPDCANYCLLLKKLYAEAIPVTVSLIHKYQDVLFENAELPKRFALTFDAGENWEQLPL